MPASLHISLRSLLLKEQREAELCYLPLGPLSLSPSHRANVPAPFFLMLSTRAAELREPGRGCKELLQGPPRESGFPSARCHQLCPWHVLGLLFNY